MNEHQPKLYFLFLVRAGAGEKINKLLLILF